MVTKTKGLNSAVFWYLLIKMNEDIQPRPEEYLGWDLEGMSRSYRLTESDMALLAGAFVEAYTAPRGENERMIIGKGLLYSGYRQRIERAKRQMARRLEILRLEKQAQVVNLINDYN